MERSPLLVCRRLLRPVVLALTLLALAAASGCGSKSGAEDGGAAPATEASAAPAGPTSTIDISGLDDPADPAPTTTAAATTTTSPEDNPMANGCRAAQTLFLEVAGGVDPGPLELSQAEIDRLSSQVMMRLSAMQRVQYRAVLAYEEELRTNPSAPVPPGLDPMAVREHLLRWTNENCPPVKPVWGCLVRSTSEEFEAVAPADAASSRPDSGAHPTPEDALASMADGGEGSTELNRTRTNVWYGWTDANGLVNRVVEVRVVEGAWVVGSVTTCGEPPSPADPVTS